MLESYCLLSVTVVWSAILESELFVLHSIDSMITDDSTQNVEKVLNRPK